MKIQDIAFFIVIIILLMLKKNMWILYVGFACLLLSIPLFVFYIFFTAERLAQYAALCFLIVALIKIIAMKIKSTDLQM